MATRILPTSQSPPRMPLLVGRQRERAVLCDLLAAACAGRGGLVLLGGEAGIGKTALAEALTDEATAAGMLALTGGCYDLTETPPYGAWVDVFRRFPRERAEPQLPTALAEPGMMGAISSQAAFFHQMLTFLTALATQQPLLIVLDDMHWADAESLDLLRFLSRSLASLPLVLIATYRPDEGGAPCPLYGMLPTLVREGHAERIDLRPLHDEAVYELVTARYTLPHAETDRLAAYVQERAEGNPFFLSELLRTLQDAAVLVRASDGWRLNELTPVRVPTLLRQVIGGRLDRIGADARHLLAIASVIGQDLALAHWQTVAAVDEMTLLTCIERTAAAHLLDPSPAGTRVRFVHALIRQTLYESILPARRRILHRQVGNAMAREPSADPDAVAYHFQQAGDERAIRWLILAGERAERAYAWLTAADRFEAAVALMDAHDGDAGERGWLRVRIARLRRYTDPQQGIAYLDIAARLAEEASDDLLGALTLFHRGLLSCFVGEINRGLAEMNAGVMARARVSVADRVRAAGMPNVFALHDAREDNGEEALVLWLAGAGRYAEARALGERTLGGTPTQLPRRMIVGAHQTDIFRGLGYAYTMLALPDEAGRAFEMVAAGLRNEENFANLGINAMDTLRLLLLYHADQREAREGPVTDAAAAWQLAADASHDDFQRYIRLPLLAVEGRWAELRRLPMATFDALASALRGALGPVLRQQGEADLAWKLIHAVLPNGPTTAPGNVRFYVAVECQRLAVALAMDDGDLDTARAWLEAHDRWLAWSGAVLGQAEGQLGWATYYRAAGETALAYERATKALAHATEPRQPLALLAAHRMLGELDTVTRRYEEAASHLHTALMLADACAAPYERALTLLALADFSAARGNGTGAITLLGEVRTICTMLGAQPTLARAESLAAHLATRVSSSPHAGRLSARECDVLRLIATGQTNQEIADALGLSVKTVINHVTHILAKTDCRNRAGATAFALNHGLA